MRRAVVDLTSARPVWSIPDSSVAVLQRAFGRGWEVVETGAVVSSDGDGASGSAASALAAKGAEVYFGWGLPPAVLDAAQGTLRWAHSAAAGVGASVASALRSGRVVLTNSRGVHAEPMADWAVAAIGFCLRGFHEATAARTVGEWRKERFTSGAVRVREFGDARIGIVGLGGIGRAVARRCRALGMEVAGVRRRPGRRVAGVTWVGGPGDLERLARRSDVLVIAAPYTAATRALVGDAVLRALPRGAFVINLSRGALLDEEALLRVLDRGHLAGCVLDVMAVEPPPPEHPFWRHPGVVFTPHVSAVSSRFWERETALMIENVRRYRAGRRLKNVVDLEAGY